jgi:hypothetical protein
VLLAAATLAMMLAHYFALAVAAAFGLYVLLYLRGRARWIAIAGLMAAGVLFVGLWGRSLLAQSPNLRSNTTWTSDTGDGHTLRVLMNMLRLPLRLVAELPADRAWMQPLAVLLAALFAIGLILVVARRRAELHLWVFWLVCTLGFIACLDLFRLSSLLVMTRYTLQATPALYVLIASAMPQTWRSSWRFAPTAVLVLLALATLPQAYTPPWKTDFRTPAEALASRLGPRDALIVSGPDPVLLSVTVMAFRHYIPPEKLPGTIVALTRPANPGVLERLRMCDRAGLIWMWNDRAATSFVPGLAIVNGGNVPYFGEVLIGKVLSDAR